MTILIDGYNLLRQVFSKEKGCLKPQRNNLIRQLSFYNKKKIQFRNEIVIVFDGGEFGRASREVHGGVGVVFSGNGASADDWIYDYTCRNSGKEILLVTLDRELKSRCSRKNVEFMDVFEFYGIVQDALVDDVEQSFSQGRDSSIKKVSEIKNEALDIMMQQVDVSGGMKKDELSEEDGSLGLSKRNPKKGNPKRLSKKDRKKNAILKKL
jgi:predicted RNA-binding protein with PIN domain